MLSPTVSAVFINVLICVSTASDCSARIPKSMQIALASPFFLGIDS
jgi:hypothetical protein